MDRGDPERNIKQLKQWLAEYIDKLPYGEHGKRIGPYIRHMRRFTDIIMADYEEDKVKIKETALRRAYDIDAMPLDYDKAMNMRAQYIIDRAIMMMIVHIYFWMAIRWAAATALWSAVATYCCMRWL